ncbi:LLM class F420-dependent oxidoreductase [Nocardia sp. NPDC051990]|uniref:LLM class F420-dependent oxidoreductase n=1 Tax=Nocardia sp. NPDC051990 TaxID=3155285 RepID=UPI00343AEE9C
MRIGMAAEYSGGFDTLAAEISDLETAGLDLVVVPEAYSFDAVSALGYLAARTSAIQLASGVMQLYTRTPTLTAMTAAGLDHLSHGRFILGLGASGPQVIEGFHGVAYDAPVGRTREVVEICRRVWRREPLTYNGSHYQIPLPACRGTGLGKPLQLINHPVRERIPIVLAAVGPKNVTLAAEIAEGWQPIFFCPEKAQQVWGDCLTAGLRNRDPMSGPLEIYASPPAAIVDDPAPYIDRVKPLLALYIGGMGARSRNFYFQLTQRYGYVAEAQRIQELYLSGRKAEAARAVPDELVRSISLIGPEGYVQERLAAFAEAGATALTIWPIGADRIGRLRLTERLQLLVR